jgi:hypothetical protein
MSHTRKGVRLPRGKKEFCRDCPTDQLAEFFRLRYETLPASVRERDRHRARHRASALADGTATTAQTSAGLALGGLKISTVTPARRSRRRRRWSTASSDGGDGLRYPSPTLCHVTPEVSRRRLRRRAAGLKRRDLLLAVAAGLEAVVRAGAGMRYPSMRARGWHSPGVIGPFGGATAVSSLLRLDAARFQNALSLAGTQSAGTFAHWGTPTIKFHQSRGAFSGLLAGLLAETGFKAGPDLHGRPAVSSLYSTGAIRRHSPVAATGANSICPPGRRQARSSRLSPRSSLEKHDSPGRGRAIDVGLSKTVYDMHGTLRDVPASFTPYDGRRPRPKMLA